MTSLRYGAKRSACVSFFGSGMGLTSLAAVAKAAVICSEVLVVIVIVRIGKAGTKEHANGTCWRAWRQRALALRLLLLADLLAVILRGHVREWLGPRRVREQMEAEAFGVPTEWVARSSEGASSGQDAMEGNGEQLDRPRGRDVWPTRPRRPGRSHSITDGGRQPFLPSEPSWNDLETTADRVVQGGDVQTCDIFVIGSCDTLPTLRHLKSDVGHAQRRWLDTDGWTARLSARIGHRGVGHRTLDKRPAVIVAHRLGRRRDSGSPVDPRSRAASRPCLRSKGIGGAARPYGIVGRSHSSTDGWGAVPSFGPSRGERGRLFENPRVSSVSRSAKAIRTCTAKCTARRTTMCTARCSTKRTASGTNVGTNNDRPNYQLQTTPHPTCGTRTTKRAPPPGASSTTTVPPCASTIAFTKLSPRPRPRCERLESPR